VRSYRLSHVLLATEALAEDVARALRGHDKSPLRSSEDDPFAAAAQRLSLCDATKNAAGELGWVDVATNNPDEEHPLFPADAVEALVRTKAPPGRRQLRPGDIVVTVSRRGAHVVRCDDVLFGDSSPKTKTWLQARREGSKSSPDDRARHHMTYEIVTMGCQMNAADSERLEGSLQALGLTEMTKIADDEAAASKDEGSEPHPDVVVLNTCSIRDRAEQKVYSQLGPYVQRKRRGERLTIAVAGCVAQQEGERLLRRVPEIDAVVGPQYANRLDDILERVWDHGEQVVATDAAKIEEDAVLPRRRSAISAWVNVVYGCNERCAFCVVPSTRGVEQSRTPQNILDELRALKEAGYKEATLLGQNVDAYGRDFSTTESRRFQFHELLEAAARTVQSGCRLRFVTSHPRYMSDRVVDVVAAYPDVLMPVFHIPAQSGDDGVLRLMGRGYTAAKYKAIVERIRARLPDATITSDFIVGCPGESDDAFERTLELMRDVRFDACMTAAYSPRPGTPMARWDGAAEAFSVLLDDGDDGASSRHMQTPVHELVRARLRQDERRRRRSGADASKTPSSSETPASVVEATRALVEAAFRRKAKALGSVDETSDRLRELVMARDVARRALQKIAEDPLFAFDPLAEIGPAQVAEDVKDARLQRINDLQKAHALERSQRYLGRVEPVLVEQRNTRRPEQVVGRTRGNKLVFFDGDADRLVGTIVDVRVTSAAAFSLTGELVS